ncbi:MAG: monomethylamine:corrinoid methyltransferase, partial [Desulfobacterales bacterium]
TEKDFNMKSLIPNVRDIVNEYEIILDKKNPITSDDAMADRLYEASIELLARTGIYCQDTNRVIQLDRREILKSVQQFREGQARFGEGKDCRTFISRLPEDKTLPWLHLGTGIVASSEEIAMAQVEGYGSIFEANSVSVPAFSHVRGMPVTGGSPLEVYASIATVQTARKALWRCGRPGLPIMNLLSSSTTAMGTIAGSYPTFGLRPSDGCLIDVLAEMKVNYETLNRLAFIQIINGNIGSTAVPILGGYAGGAPGTALVKTAYYLVGMHMFQGTYHLTLPIHFNFGCNSMREALWVFAISGRAASRNTRYPAIAIGFAAAGPCTRMFFYVAATTILSQVPSGYAGIQTPHPAKAVVDDAVTPMEAKFTVELTRAITGMQAHQANELANRLLEKYEDDIANAPQGKKYQECYNLKTQKPSEEYIQLYDEVVEEMIQMGLSFK